MSRRRYLWNFLVGLALAAHAPLAFAQEKQWERAFDVIYETQWQQSGILDGVKRWPARQDKVLTFTINVGASSSNADRARSALARVLAVLDMTTRELVAGDETAQIQFDIRRFAPEELLQHACYAQSTSSGGQLSRVKLVLNEPSTYWCVLHELMHAMGLPGHPQGDTVLSYFEGNRLSLKPIDEFLLRAWYTDGIKPGMSPLVAVRIINRMWIEQSLAPQEQARAALVERQWYERTIAGLEAFANGAGEPPLILFRSGKLNATGMKMGQMNVQSILGFSYFNGLSVAQDRIKGAGYMLKAAQNGNRNAVANLLRVLAIADLPVEASATLCKWFATAAVEETGLTKPAQDQALASAACKPGTDSNR